MPEPPAWNEQPGPLHAAHLPGSGGGAPAIFFHGFAGDCLGWLPLIQALGQQRTTIRIELPGHGRSPRRRVRDFSDLAAQMADAFQSAHAGPVHLVGHSLGGALALATAAALPGRVLTLSLLAPAGLGSPVDHDAVTGLVTADSPGRLGHFLRRLPADPALFDDALVALAMEARADPKLRAAQADMAQALFAGPVQTIDLRAQFRGLGMPGALIWGRSDAILPVPAPVDLPPMFSQHLLAHTGHVPHLENPAAVAGVLAPLFRAADPP